MDFLHKVYKDHAPRWVKVIKWNEWGYRIMRSQSNTWRMMIIPATLIYYSQDNFPFWMWLYRPQSMEEVMGLKRDSGRISFQRANELGQYEKNVVPPYDLAERRKAYPQYYAGRYDGFKKTGV